MPDTRVFIRRIPKRYKISTVWGKMGRFSRGILAGVSKTTLLSWYEVKGCIFFLFCDVFRRITTQKQLFFADLRDCVALGMEYFSAYATLLDFGDNLRCMKQVANSLACQGIRQSVALHYTSHALRNLLICDTMQPRRQSLRGHGLSPYKKTISHCFLRERAPDEAAWVCFFAWLVAFVKI